MVIRFGTFEHFNDHEVQHGALCILALDPLCMADLWPHTAEVKLIDASAVARLVDRARSCRGVLATARTAALSRGALARASAFCMAATATPKSALTRHQTETRDIRKGERAGSVRKERRVVIGHS